MGTCCKPSGEELILETFGSENGKNKDKYLTDHKDKYPHDSDSAFKPSKNQEIRDNVFTTNYEVLEDQINGAN